MTFPIIPASTVSSGYQISRSLRFRSSASAYLSRTPASLTNTQTVTISAWVKLGTLGSARTLFMAGTGSTAQSYLQLNSSDKLVWYSMDSGILRTNLTTTQVFRDTSAWYHIVAVYDETNATSGNKARLYVNGTRVTAFDTATYPPGGAGSYWNNTVANGISRDSWQAANYFDGYLSEVNFIDGQALTPSSFGAFDTNGVWQPARYTGSYGTNGFYLPFTLNSTSSYAASFNGTNQSLALTANSSLQFGTGDFTVEGWYYQNGTVNYGNIFSTTGLYSTSGGIRLSTGPNNNTFQVATAAGALFNASSAFQASAWLHFAVVRSSGTTKLYVNGVSVGSAADTNSYTADTFRIGWVDGTSSSTYLLNGLLSNFRVVKGTAVYTANFTPPSSPLTAISGTSLLTLQNSTIVDNSTNNFSFTNNGTVTTATATPFVANVFADASGNNNTWTGNNINYSSSGTTYDSMIDSPTNYADGGNGRGNYAVLNPIANPNGSIVTYSNANLSYSYSASAGNGALMSVIGTIGIDTGKYYWEFTANSSNAGFGAGGPLRFGTGGFGYPANYTAYFSGSWNSTSGTLPANPATFTAGDVLAIAIDVGARTAQFFKNNVSQGTITNIDVIPLYFPVIVAASSSASGGGDINFGQRPFTYTPPSGFSALNTQNLPTPTIAAGNKYFDATTYTGNGGTQSITNSGSFQPDLVWVKDRVFAYNHALYDAVRGVQKWLSSSTTDAENTYGTGELTAFNSNGFTLVNSANYQNNKSSDTYIAWQWKAGGTGVSNTSGSITSTVSANTSAGFSVVTATAPASGSFTIGHGLGVTPGMVIVKPTAGGTANWAVWHQSLGSSYYLNLNQTAAQTSTTYWGTMTSSLISFAATNLVNASSAFVCYAFAPVAGYSAFGGFTANGVSGDGSFIYTGFLPRFILYKRTDSTSSWFIHDTSRQGYNVQGPELYPDSSAVEATATRLDILSNGFKIRAAAATNPNVSSATYIYACFASNPFKTSRAF